MSYNPFDKSLSELTLEDLQVIIQKEVAEGYWVEYKSEMQSSKKIAKSISSFANTFGGWYFVGIKADKIRNVAEEICGFDLSTTPDPIDTLRESIKSNVDPTPIFYHKLLSMDNGKAVLIVQIPNKQETPFVTSDGRIYRRVGDSSDPIPEDNRYAIDRLVDNGKQTSVEFEEFCQDTRSFSESENDQSWVNLFVSPYHLGKISKREMMTNDGIKNALSLSHTPLKYYLYSKEVGTVNLPLNSGQFGFGSIILKQVETSRVAFNSLTTELFIDGRAKFHIPIINLPNVGSGASDVIKSKEVKRALGPFLHPEIRDENSFLLRFFDIRSLWAVILNHLTFYQNYFGKDLADEDLKIAITLQNVWRLVPFSDSDAWGLFVQEFGLPVQNKDEIRIPSRHGKGIITNGDQWHTICSLISFAFGLSPALFSDIMFGVVKEQE